MLMGEFVHKYWIIRNACGELGAEKEIVPYLDNVLKIGLDSGMQPAKDNLRDEIPQSMAEAMKSMEAQYASIKEKHPVETVKKAESKSEIKFQLFTKDLNGHH